MQVQLVDGVSMILRELEMKEMKQKDIAQTYAMLMTMNDRPVDWGTVNTAIVRRWSKAGLIAVKKAAWKLVEEKSAALDAAEGVE